MVTQQLNGAQNISGQRCQRPVHWNQQTGEFDLCNTLALYAVVIHADPVYLCQEHFAEYMAMLKRSKGDD